jgi:glyoxylase-like metal-dependent hydrolase (beta-lactamase superfamily II)/rhodanese-related sulfurtransferase
LFFKQVLYEDLGCASYVVADAGEAVIVDPRWDIDVYLEIARQEELQIAYILDTHDHADHVSGRRRLARITGARSYHAVVASDDAEDGIRPGDEIAVGSIRVRAVPAPGHRPEHIVFAVADLTRGTDIWILLTGDSLLVGDLARPDLAVEARAGASLMHASLHSLLEFGDHVEVWPGHVGGSLCGGADLSHKTSSTVGFERLHNPLLAADHDQFVRGITESMPPRPPNIERIVEINRAGTAVPDALVELPIASAAEHLVTPHVSVLDAREPEAYDVGHLAGSINLPSSSHGVGTRAGWSVAPDEPIIIVADGPELAHRMAIALEAVGLWRIIGYLADDRSAWERERLPVATSGSWNLDQLARGVRRDEVDLIDVRDESEWIAGHVPGSRNVPLDRLRAGRSLDLPENGRTTAVACAAGNRAAFAASLLRRAGHANVVRVSGGGVADLATRGINLDLGA